MKKVLSILLVVFVLTLTLALVACTGGGQTTTPIQTIPTTTTTNQDLPVDPPIDDHEHSYNAVVSAPTLKSQGYTTYTCACGDSYVDDYVPMLVASEGLVYTLNDDGSGYSVSDIGTCTDTDIVIPDTYEGLPVTSIGEHAFPKPQMLTSVVIPDSVTNISMPAFYACPLLSDINVSENNQYYKSIDGNLYTKDGKNLIQYAMGKTDTSFTIPDSVTSIGDWAFACCWNLTSVEIPCSVTSIGNSAFFGCNGFISVVIPNSVTSIAKEAFSNCNLLTSVVIGNSVTSIGDGAFYYCRSLTSILIPDSVTSIGDDAFAWCESLTSIVFDGAVEQWYAITKGERWNHNVPATEVICSDGTVTLE